MREETHRINRATGKEELTRYGEFMLGLAVSAATLAPGDHRTQDDLAAYTGVTHQAIQQIERRALFKVRDALGDIGPWQDLFAYREREVQGYREARVAGARTGDVGFNDVRVACERWLHEQALKEAA